jgi:hypothetical protein
MIKSEKLLLPEVSHNVVPPPLFLPFSPTSDVGNLLLLDIDDSPFKKEQCFICSFQLNS